MKNIVVQMHELNFKTRATCDSQLQCLEVPIAGQFCHHRVLADSSGLGGLNPEGLDI